MKNLFALILLTIFAIPALGSTSIRLVDCDVSEHENERVSFFYSNGEKTLITIFDKYASGGNVIGRFIEGDGSETSAISNFRGIAVVNFKTELSEYEVMETTADAFFKYLGKPCSGPKPADKYRKLINCVEQKEVN